MQWLEIGFAGVSMKTIEDKPDRRVIRAPHHLPGITVIVDMPPPGERLKPDTQPALCRSLAQLVEIGRAAVYAASESGDTLLQTSSESQPSSCMRSNLRSARSKVRWRCGSGMPSKSRKG